MLSDHMAPLKLNIAEKNKTRITVSMGSPSAGVPDEPFRLSASVSTNTDKTHRVAEPLAESRLNRSKSRLYIVFTRESRQAALT